MNEIVYSFIDESFEYGYDKHVFAISDPFQRGDEFVAAALDADGKAYEIVWEIQNKNWDGSDTWRYLSHMHLEHYDHDPCNFDFYRVVQLKD